MAAGSSPLARGLPGGGDLIGQGGGIIPARAGFTSPPCTRCARARDHPRSRGVYSSCMRVGTASVGSSPLARGLPVADPAGLVGHGDHPRSRGVYPRRRHRAGGALGSSPLARGLLPPLRARWSDERIIPARAGFTEEQRYRRRHPGDHPRSRGVYRHDAPPVWAWKGSSPLARGLRGGLEARGYREGIIPARAGFTCATPIRR